ncbi:MAG: helix-turn-helix domain-containing protein [Halobacteria archaeon]|nr:helix-turn-helix domain-containing protein [Halobacteria archaeon]
MGIDEEDDVLERVSRRFDFLQHLDKDGLTKPELVRELDISRSTVERAIRELEDLGSIEYFDGEYRLTVPGELLLQAYGTFINDINDVSGAMELLNHIPSDAPFDACVLKDAEVVSPKKSNTYRPDKRIREIVTGSQHLGNIAKSHSRSEAIEVFNRRIVHDGMTMETVFQEDMYRNLRSMENEALDEFMSSDRMTAYVTDEVPYGMFLSHTDTGKKVCLIVYDDDNLLRGVIINDSQEAVEWAEGVIEEYIRRGREVEWE